MRELPERFEGLLERFRAGKRLGLARAISVVENERDGFQALLHEVLRQGLQAARLGVTGPPGAGKSTLVAALATSWRERGDEVGVVAVDPTSPYSGGALLGDRIRMNDLTLDPGIFIRSMATRGSLGGLATTTKEVIDLMDGFGFPRVMVETVGVGQTELEITGATDTVVVVLVPESGDAIQAMKAGLMEIADIFVVNKADRPGADRLAKEIRQAIHLRTGDGTRGSTPGGGGHHGVDLAAVARRREAHDTAGGRDGTPDAGDTESDGRAGRSAVEPTPQGKGRRWEAPEGWQIPVIKTVAQTGQGVAELMEAVEAHRTHLTESGELEERRRARAERRTRDVVERELRRTAWRSEVVNERLTAGLDGIASGTETPYSVAREILEILLGPPGT